jgi:uncharacterized protein YkwD
MDLAKSLKPLIFAVLLATSGAFGQTAFAQNTDLQPTARLIDSYTTPRARHITTDVAVQPVAPAAEALSLDKASEIERTAFEKTNRERQKAGLAALVWDAELCRMSRIHSASMARLGFLTHATPEGSRLQDRARAAGIMHFAVIGENIAYNQGYEDPGAFAVERWMVSSGHRANILSSEFRAMAVGTYVAPDGSVFLTQTFILR